MSVEDDGGPAYPPPPPDLVLLAPPAAATQEEQGPPSPPTDPALRPHGEKRGLGDEGGYEAGDGDGVVEGQDGKRRREGRRGYTRTGQACDRCKARKVKCDGLPGGCSPCAAAGVECFVTDRVSGRTERRGYLRDLERERERMVGYIRDLELLVGARTGLRLRPSPWTAGLYGADEPEGGGGGEWEQVGEVVVARGPG